MLYCIKDNLIPAHADLGRFHAQVLNDLKL